MTDDPMAASPRPAEPQTIRLPTSDAGQVVADLVVSAQPWAGAVVCHPHPAYGGDRHNVVVDRIFHTLAAAGATALRFDFRGDGGGATEQLDVLAGLDAVAEHLGPERPLWLIGYSFGADVALSVGDDRVAGWAAVAPPLRFGPPPRAATGDRRPVLVVAAEHDQFTLPDRLAHATADWSDATLEVVPSADHFLLGAAPQVADTLLTWLQRHSS